MLQNNYKYNANFFIFTGGPGSGKSSLIHKLSEHFCTVPETGRAIIQEQVKRSGDALPWKKRTLFARYMLARDVDNYLGHEAVATPVLFDRGIPDVWGYTLLSSIRKLPQAASYATYYRYNRTVFMLPPWQAIYQQDNERKQDFALAKATYQMMCKTYMTLGYDIITLPKASIEERAQIVRENLFSLFGAQ